MTQPTPPALSRRQLLGLAAAGAALPLAAQPARAQSPAQVPAQPWPAKPLRVVVAFPPGGLADVLMRHLQAPLQEALGQPLLIDNRGGAAGNLAATEVIRNGGDGHTVLVTVTTTESVNPLLFPRLGFDPQRDLQHVALLANTQLFLATRPTLPPSTVAELVAYAKARPGQLSYGSAGSGTTPHLAGELFKQGAGVFATHIPYRGAAPVIQDLIAGQVDFGFVPGTVFPAVKAGKLKLLAVASRQRPPNRPDAPTLAEAGVPGVYADTLFGVYAPAAMPSTHVQRLNQAINRLLATEPIKARFAELGADAVPLSPEAFKAMVAGEVKVFGGIVRARGIQVD
ncbi:tripartite tricarboxylate transporter substrate-binding protein [Ideonella sp. DXS22W]|uniref:Tripartite tricarboxylate transporter substrate-binding protein n=1 Tax=Pseudaquabacterium inlustre TaxID=2984192 RepID=A0ABU9CP11_9BURK